MHGVYSASEIILILSFLLSELPTILELSFNLILMLFAFAFEKSELDIMLDKSSEAINQLFSIQKEAINKIKN